MKLFKNFSRFTFLFLILFIWASHSLFAHHFVSGNLSYTWLNDQEVILKLSLLIEEGTDNGATIDDAAPIQVYFRPQGATDYENFTLTSVEPQPIDLFKIPLTTESYSQANHIFSFDDFENDGDYLFVYQRCCRTVGLNNLIDSVGVTLSTVISYTAGAFTFNDSPELTERAKLEALAGEAFTLPFPINENDGDSLSFEFSPIFDGGGVDIIDACNRTLPISFCPPPYQELSFSDPLTFVNMMICLSVNRKN